MLRKKKVTNQLAAVPIDVSSVKDRKTVSFRKIDNGYIINTSGVQNGKYFDREIFSPKQPKIDIVKVTKK
jgi:hypothetical protein